MLDRRLVPELVTALLPNPYTRNDPDILVARGASRAREHAKPPPARVTARFRRDP